MERDIEEVFEHVPLTDARNRIRLIQVQAPEKSAPNTPLQVSIKSITRKNAFKNYRALSYRWGDSTTLCTILLNQKVFKVPQLLFEFLSHVARKRGEPKETEDDGEEETEAEHRTDIPENQNGSPQEQTTRGTEEQASKIQRKSSDFGDCIFEDQSELNMSGKNVEGLREKGLRSNSLHRIQIDWGDWWWIDAMCIPQKDSDEEKTVQIQCMRQTYADAYQTIMWLGTGDVESTRSLETFQRVLISQSLDVFRIARKDLSQQDPIIFKPVQDLIDADPTIMKAMTKVIENSYWTRVWIIQELAASRSKPKGYQVQSRLSIVFGDFVTNWDRFDKICTVLFRTSYQSLMPHIKVSVAELFTMSLRRQIVREYGYDAAESIGYSLAMLLLSTSYSKSSLPQDYIYGILGLTNKMCRDSIRPSYNISGCAVISQAIRFMRSEVGMTEDLMEYFDIATKNTLHNPFDTSYEMNSAREECTGLGWQHLDPERSDNLTNICEPQYSCTKHCHALALCREIARYSFFYSSGVS